MAHFHHQILLSPTDFNFATSVIDYWATQTPSNPALLWVPQDLDAPPLSLTYSHFVRQSHRISILLRENLGLAKGDKMVMIMARIPAWWEVGSAGLRCGIVLCPATTLLVDTDIAYRVQRSKASVFVGDNASVGKFLKIRSECPSVRHIICVDGAGTNTTLQSAGVLNLQTELAKIPEDAVWRGDVPKSEDAALIYFTSGTTGYPKMVQHSQSSYPLAHTITGKHWLRLAPGKVYWNMAEQGWGKAAWAWFGAWNCGAALFVHDDREAFKGEKVLRILSKYPIDTMCAPPTAYRQLVVEEMREVFKAIPPLRLEHCTSAGEPINAEIIRLWKEMSGIRICDGYGQTETTLVCGNYGDKEIKPGSMGLPLPGVPLLVVDSEGNECEVGVEGDMALEVVSGKGGFFGILNGYLLEDGTLDSRVSTGNNGRKFYRTGDKAKRDNDGYFWFVGRNDDVINSSGYRIGPFEVESTLRQHPAVVESAVVSSPDKDRGEVVKAFVVLAPRYTTNDPAKLVKELQDFCKDKAAPYKYPRKIQFVGTEFLPKTISGKIKRNELKNMEWTKDEQTVRAKL